MKSKLKNLLAASIFCGAALLVGVVGTPDSTAENQQGCGDSRDGTVEPQTLICQGQARDCTEITVCGDLPG